MSATPDAVGERLPWQRWRWPATSGGGGGGEGGRQVENSRSEGIGGWKLFFFFFSSARGDSGRGLPGETDRWGPRDRSSGENFPFPDLLAKFYFLSLFNSL